MKPIYYYILAPLVVAALAPLGATGAIPKTPLVYFVAVPVVLFFTVIVGMPMLFALPKSKRTHAPSMLGVAFVAAAISYLIMAFPSAHSSQFGLVFLQALGVGLAALPGGLLFLLGARAEAKWCN